MSKGFDWALLVAGALLLPPASSLAADNPEVGSSRPDPSHQASMPAVEWGGLSMKPPDLALVLYDPRGALPYGADVMAREVEAIFAGLGVSVGWKKGGPGITFGGGPELEVAVVLMRPAWPPGRRKRPRPSRPPSWRVLESTGVRH